MVGSGDASPQVGDTVFVGVGFPRARSVATSARSLWILTHAMRSSTRFTIQVGSRTVPSSTRV